LTEIDRKNISPSSYHKPIRYQHQMKVYFPLMLYVFIINLSAESPFSWDKTQK
jgi:hypothetical protein